MATTHPSASEEYGSRSYVPKRQKKGGNTGTNYYPGVMRPIYEKELVRIRTQTYDTHLSWNKPCVVLLFFAMICSNFYLQAQGDAQHV